MTINHKALVAGLCAAIMLSPSCKKPDETPSTPTDTPVAVVKTGAAAKFAPLKSPVQNFTVTAGVAKKIKGAQGTILSFYPNSFKDAAGNPITSGTINIRLTEMYTMGDMIANRTSTTTGDGVLVSAGEMNIVATNAAGQEVFANKYGLGFKAPGAAASKPMELYTGDANNPDSVVTWGIKKGGAGTYVAGTTYITDTALSLVEQAYFMFDSVNSFKWVNADHPYDATSQNVTLNVVFPDNSFQTEYCGLSISFPSLMITTSLFPTEYHTSSHIMTFKGWVPIGPTAKFSLIMPINDNSYYYYEQSGAVTNGMSITASMLKLSKNELKAKLAAL